MPATYRITSAVRLSNQVWTFMVQRGIGPKSMHLLTVRGRKSGALHTNVVSLITEGGSSYLVAPYGIVNWVQNARAAGQVRLERAGKSWQAKIEELPPHDAAPLLKKYLAGHVVTRPYFDVGSDAPAEAFEREASRHPVFLLRRMG